ncbi:MAG: TatD family hydrolase [Clostridia bacterium]|nr:TatD family hydrolase [Clostridia bacterium]MDD4047729.1 TatD family hydrolase [Clostridia bacterium]
MFFDTHAHLDDEQFTEDRVDVISRLREAGVELVINVGCNMQSSLKSVEITKEYDFIYGAVGIHPHDASDLNEESLGQLRELAREPRIVAVGEIGLDYYYDYSPRELQKKCFREMIGMAKELKLPIIIHDRDAHEDTLKIVKEEKANEVGGVFHCYSGSWEMAKEVMKLGFYMAIGGAVTFKNAKKVVEVAQEIPLDHLLIETDCPYLAPVPYRGKRNEPAYVSKVAERIAEIKGISIEEVAKATLENGKRLFGLTNHLEVRD